jgi:hypothetical protein
LLAPEPLVDAAAAKRVLARGRLQYYNSVSAYRETTKMICHYFSFW